MKPDIPCAEMRTSGGQDRASTKESNRTDTILAPACNARKRLATLTARAALVGVTVHKIESDFGGEEFVASRWALTKAFNTLDALDAWLTRVTGKAA